MKKFLCCVQESIKKNIAKDNNNKFLKLHIYQDHNARKIIQSNTTFTQGKFI